MTPLAVGRVSNIFLQHPVHPAQLRHVGSFAVREREPNTVQYHERDVLLHELEHAPGDGPSRWVVDFACKGALELIRRVVGATDNAHHLSAVLFRLSDLLLDGILRCL